MTAKFTMIFGMATEYSDNEQVQANRMAGWSESFYTDGSIDSTGFRTTWRRLCQARAALLPKSAFIVAQRVQQIDAFDRPGLARSYEEFFRGTYGVGDQDLPQVSLNFNCRSLTTPNRRIVNLRGCPDSVVRRGEYGSVAAYTTRVRTFFDNLRADWMFRARVRTNANCPIQSVSAGGVYVLKEDSDWAVGDKVRILRGEGTDGHSYGGVFRVSARADARNGTLANYADDIEVGLRRGSIRKDAIQYVGITIDENELVYPDATVHKVGAPFKKFRGRRSAKR